MVYRIDSHCSFVCVAYCPSEAQHPEVVVVFSFLEFAVEPRTAVELIALPFFRLGSYLERVRSVVCVGKVIPAHFAAFLCAHVEQRQYGTRAGCPTGLRSVLASVPVGTGTAAVLKVTLVEAHTVAGYRKRSI